MSQPIDPTLPEPSGDFTVIIDGQPVKIAPDARQPAALTGATSPSGSSAPSTRPRPRSAVAMPSGPEPVEVQAMRPIRFRLRVRTMIALVALVALGLACHRVYQDGPDTHWLLLKLRYGNASARRSAAIQVRQSTARSMFQNVIAPVVWDPVAPRELERGLWLQKRREELLVPVLLQVIKDRDAGCRAEALRALSGVAIGNLPASEKRLVLQQIIAATHDPDAFVRVAAVSSMASPDGQDIAAAIEVLQTALTDSSVEVRQAAAFELGSLGVVVPTSQPAIASILLPLLASGENPRVRVKAAWALGRFGRDQLRHPAGTGPDVVPALLSALRDRDVEVRQAVAMIFSSGDSWIRRKDVIMPSLEAATKEEDKVVRDNSALALFEMGRRDPAFIELIQQAAAEPNRKDAYRFASALKKWADEVGEKVPVVVSPAGSIW